MPHQSFQSADIKPRYAKGRISALGVNSVYPRIPWIVAWWSATFPGYGHMFIGKYLHGFVLVIWELVVNSQANLNKGIALSFLGRFEEAKAQLNQDWVLLYVAVYVYSIWDSYRFLPSMYAFAIYQAYTAVIEANTLYDIEQIRYLRVRDANLAQLDTVENSAIQIIATFEHSPSVEMAIHDIEKLGVPSESIVALPLENLESGTHIFDSIRRVDGRSVLDGAMMGGTIFMVLGTIYGFAWHWGPVIWALIGLAGGFTLGLAIELALNMISKEKLRIFAGRKNEVVMQVTCDVSLRDQLINVFKSRGANGFVVRPQTAINI